MIMLDGRRPSRKGFSMSHFVIQFQKDVLGENGQYREICQSNVEIDAGNKIDAAELAKKKFCQDEGISKWSLHADRIQVRAADFPS